jgi:hypothetical protein
LVSLALPYFYPYVDGRDIAEIVGRIRQVDRDIQVFPINIERQDRFVSDKLKRNPLATVELARTRDFRPPRGPWLRSEPVHKRIQCSMVEKAGLSLPKTITYKKGIDVTEEMFGEFIFIKATHIGASVGTGNFLMRTRDFDKARPDLDRVFGQPFATPPIIQQYIHTGKFPQNYRVVTVLEKPVHMTHDTALHEIKLNLPHSTLALKESAQTNMGGAHYRFDESQDVLDFAVSIAKVFDDRSVIGIDIIREESSGKLYFLEANIGNVWLFSNTTGQKFRNALGPDSVEKMKAQFNAFELIPAILAKYARDFAA